MGLRMLVDFTMGIIFMLLLNLIVYLIATRKDRKQHKVKKICQEWQHETKTAYYKTINEKTKKAKVLLNPDALYEENNC